MENILRIICSTEFFYSIFRVTTPILLAALGAMITSRAGVVNIGLEGIMLFSALAGVVTSAWTQSAAVGLLATKKYRKYGAFLLAGLAIGVLIGNLTLKPLIARPRPCWLDESVQLLIANPTDYSFPSGHTLSSVIGATVLTKANRKFGFAAIPLAALIAFSRLYLYVHFPTDILAAAVLGVGIGLVTCTIGDKLWTALAKKGAFLNAR